MKKEKFIGVDIAGCCKNEDGSYSIFNSFEKEIGKIYPGDRAEAYAAFIGESFLFFLAAMSYKRVMWRFTLPDWRSAAKAMKNAAFGNFADVHGQLEELIGRLKKTETTEDDENARES